MDSLQNGDSLVMLGSLVRQLVQPAPHRCPPVPWRSAREMSYGKICHAEVRSFRVENGQRVEGLRHCDYARLPELMARVSSTLSPAMVLLRA
jgi:hypothetical protein